MSDIEKLKKNIQKIYEIDSAGGYLHIVLDDGNLDNRSINFCKQFAEEYKADISKKYYKLIIDTIKILKKFSIEERKEIIFN